MTQPVQYPPSVLRVTPEAIPALRAAIDDTLFELSPLLQRMQTEGYMPEPWLGDSASHATWAMYNDEIMGAPDGPFHAMLAYEQQLVAISTRLTEIEREYQRADADAGAMFGNPL